MNIASYTKSILSGVGSALATVTTGLTLAESLPTGYGSLIAAVVSMVAGTGAVTTFAVWLAANAPRITSDVKAAEPLLKDAEQLVGKVRELTSSHSQTAPAAAPAPAAATTPAPAPVATPAVVAEPASVPVAAAAPIVTAVESAVASVADLLAANKIR